MNNIGETTNKLDYMEDLNETIATCYSAIDAIRVLQDNSSITDYEALIGMQGYLQVALEAKKEYYRLENDLI